MQIARLKNPGIWLASAAGLSPTSDYDLAFVLEDTQGWERFATDQQEEAGTLLPLDLVNFHAAPASLQDEIRASGVVLYEQ